MPDAPRRPIPTLTPQERRRRLAERGLGEDLLPLNLSPMERQAMTDPNAPQPQSATTPTPAAGAVLKQGWVQALTVVGVVAAGALAASEAGVLPPWVGAVSQAVIGLLAAVGIASPGIRKV
jgi:hypothetical protein